MNEIVFLYWLGWLVVTLVLIAVGLFATDYIFSFYILNADDRWRLHKALQMIDKQKMLEKQSEKTNE